MSEREKDEKSEPPRCGICRGPTRRWIMLDGTGGFECPPCGWFCLDSDPQEPKDHP